MSATDLIDAPPELDGDFLPRMTQQLVGHDGQIAEMVKAGSGQRMPHAWLLTGPRGVGKASFAYLVARAMLAQTPLTALGTAQNGDIENLVASEAHPDLFVLRRRFDLKTEKFQSDIPIASVREMIDGFGLTAAMGGWRVCIIDAIDDMNRNSTNALLKVLEEPPSKCLFLIVCHNSGRLLDTIRSRCRQLSFGDLAPDQLDAVLAGLFADKDPNERAATAYLAAGSAGMAVRLIEGDGLAMYREMVDVLAGLPAPDVTAVHALAGRFTNKAEDQDRFALFAFLLRGWLYRLVRSKSRGEAALPVFTGEAELIDRFVADLALEPVIAMWEKIGDDVANTEAYNLDRRNTVLSWLETAGQVLGVGAKS